jgi:RNA polymerase sigma-70 factor, ECF subfamily
VIGSDPADVVTSKESVRLAFVAALQYLPPRQRAVLVLRDVLKWRAAEVAQALGTTPTAVNSALQRARAQLAAEAPSTDSLSEPAQGRQRELLEAYVAAFEAKDISAIVDLFTADAVWEMPPFLTWFQGSKQIAALIDRHCPAERPGDQVLLPIAANGQPAFALYMRHPDGGYLPFNIQVLTLTPDGVSHVVAFQGGRFFDTFGLPASLPATAGG